MGALYLVFEPTELSAVRRDTTSGDGLEHEHAIHPSQHVRQSHHPISQWRVQLPQEGEA